MKLGQLEYLVAVADHGTVTAAARELYVAQPAVSRAIQALEHELGIALFERRGGRLVLTSVGHEVVGHARRALDAVVDIQAVAAHAAEARDRSITVATTPTLEEITSERLLPLVRELVPGAHLVIRSATDPAAVAELVRAGDADVGLSDHPPDPDLGAVALFDEEIVLACPPGSDPTPLAFTELGAVPLILPRAGSGRRAEFDAFFDAFGIAPTVTVETDDRAAWSTHVRAGLGCAFRYRSQVERLARDGVVGRPLVPPVVRHVVLLHTGRGLTRPARLLVDRLAGG